MVTKATVAGIVRSVSIEVAEDPKQFGRPKTGNDVAAEQGGGRSEAVAENDVSTSGSSAEVAEEGEGLAQVTHTGP